MFGNANRQFDCHRGLWGTTAIVEVEVRKSEKLSPMNRTAKTTVEWSSSNGYDVKTEHLFCRKHGISLSFCPTMSHLGYPLNLASHPFTQYDSLDISEVVSVRLGLVDTQYKNVLT